MGRHWRPVPVGWMHRHTEGLSEGKQLALLVIAGLLVWQLTNILLLVFAAILVAVILSGLAETLARALHIPVSLALALVTLVLAGVTVAVAYWIVPTLLGQASDIGTRVAQQWHALRQNLGQTPLGRSMISGAMKPDNLEGRAASFALVSVRDLAGETGEIVAALITSVYLAADAPFYTEGAICLLPPRMRPTTRRVAAELTTTLRRWLLGQLIDMVTVGGLSAAGLYYLGIPAPFALATFAGLMTIIPYFGALIAAAPGILVALTQGPSAALWTAAIYAGCHMLEGYVVGPLVQRRMVRMPPAVIIVSLSVSAGLFGPLGFVLGAPLGVVALVLVKRLYTDRLGDEPGGTRLLP
jgi:predicted PurR-regulated permease PerM